MLSFELDGGSTGANRVSDGNCVFKLATSLDGVESLIYPPTAWMEAAVPESLKQLPGSPWVQNPGLIRLSVGIESTRDLVNDLERALA
jgi:cystathionine beta-lyase/cystathionine gamma-synthase